MVPLISRILLLTHTQSANYIKVARYTNRVMNSQPTFSRRGVDQVEYIKAVVQNKDVNWATIRTNVLQKQGHLTEKNYDGVLLKILTNDEQYDAALSFTNHLKKSSHELSLGAINGILNLYHVIAQTRNLSREEKAFILDSYEDLYDKYKILDFSTCEKLISALCVIDELEKSLRVLEDIYYSAVPSHKAYSMIISTLFRKNKKEKAMELINKCIEDKRPLKYYAFEEWINYILRKYEEKDKILKHLDEIYQHISKNYAVVDENTAMKLKDTFEFLGWHAGFTRIRKMNGQCSCCRESLDLLQLTEEEYKLLQQNVKDNLIVGSDLFLKTSLDELKRFLDFVEKTAPYDIVIDALNVAYTIGKAPNSIRLNMLCSVVDYFKQRNKKILLLGRKHMLKWGKGNVERLKSNTYSFFTEDLSQDDPYFITAAILSGPHTDIVSKDLLRGHQFLLKNKQLDYVFKRWQWQHQWMVYVHGRNDFKIQAPLTFTPCAQKKDNAWHLPFERKTVKETKFINDGIPDLYSWLCIRPRGEQSA